MARATLVASGAGAHNRWGRFLPSYVTLSAEQPFTWRRTFTVEDVRQFRELSGDRGLPHVQPETGWRLGWSQAEGRSRNLTNLVTGITQATASAGKGFDEYVSNERG